MDRGQLEALDRESLVARATAAGIRRARILTRPELIDELLRLDPNIDESALKKSRGFFGRARDLLSRVSSEHGTTGMQVSEATLQALAAHDWPGNVRELRNVLEQAAMLTDHTRLEAADFASILGTSPGKDPKHRSLPQLIAELERRSIESALAATHGNKVSAAKMLGISRATLYEKLKELSG